MSPPPVRIKIGGALDSSLATSLRSAAQMVGQAERSIEQRKRETTKAAESEARRWTFMHTIKMRDEAPQEQRLVCGCFASAVESTGSHRLTCIMEGHGDG